MDATVDALSSAYLDFVAAAAAVVEAKEQSGGQKTALTEAALENFKQRWELFAVRWLVIELQHGSGPVVGSGAAHNSASAPFDARFSDDSAP
ncbi:Mediator of RNA polymerase II transcription subunit 32 [Platanthera guangdongensis]|uniref:Mediator of RNA polymerase II transcription subunit 32 n=1 Tax=Platanthera guangdongensis TaxID=2320717 RepID=A0ABR2MH06_9ASPA